MELFQNTLRTALLKRLEDYDKFDRLFRSFWLLGHQDNPLGRISIPSGKKIERTIKKSNLGTNEIGRGRITAGSIFSSISSQTDGQEKLLGIYSPLETISRKGFEDLSVARDRAVLKRGMRSLARATATRPGRRFESVQSGSHLDFRGMLRQSLRTGEIAFEVERRDKKISKSRLLVLCDISGSMDSYSGRILKLIYHLCNTVRGTKVFGFSTQVVPLNDFLLGKSLTAASTLVSKHVEIWSSGTRIGSALGDLLSEYSGYLKTSTTILVVISDGWELGDIANLRSKMAEVRRRVRGIVWLNPQADSLDYAPLAEGMKMALPYVDVFAGLDIFSNRAKFLRAFRGSPLQLGR